MVGVGALAGLHIFGRELHRRDLPAGAVNAAIGGLMFGLAGAKLLWVLEHVSEEPFLSLVLMRGGMSWFGGFAGGVGAGSLFLRLARVPLVPALAAAAPALAMGQAIGRVGCFLVGDDYGRPTDLLWGVAFPHGSPAVLSLLAWQPPTRRVVPTIELAGGRRHVRRRVLQRQDPT